MGVAIQRRGKWFDPELVDALVGLKSEMAFWDSLKSTDLVEELRAAASRRRFDRPADSRVSFQRAKK